MDIEKEYTDQERKETNFHIRNSAVETGIRDILLETRRLVDPANNDLDEEITPEEAATVIFTKFGVEYSEEIDFLETMIREYRKMEKAELNNGYDEPF